MKINEKLVNTILQSEVENYRFKQLSTVSNTIPQQQTKVNDDIGFNKLFCYIDITMMMFVLISHCFKCSEIGKTIKIKKKVNDCFCFLSLNIIQYHWLSPVNNFDFAHSGKFHSMNKTCF